MTRPRFEEPSRAIQLVADLVRDGYSSGDLEDLARRHPEWLRTHHRALIDAGVLYPSFLFTAASEDTVDALIRLVDDGQAGRELGSVLGALAWTRTTAAVDAFGRWRQSPPPGTDQLPVPVADYAHDGGWELDAAGRRRPLATDVAFALEPSRSSAPETKERCPWCNLGLVELLNVDLSSPPLTVLGLAEAGPVGVVTCIRCGLFTTVLTEYDAAGSVRWARENTRPSFIGRDGDGWEVPAEHRLLQPGSERANQYLGSAWDDEGSTVGGLPDWIQDAEYPVCPRCDRSMFFLAMVTGTALWNESAEGCYYIFIDTACSVTAASYQQS